jgi:hypothetical protein
MRISNLYDTIKKAVIIGKLKEPFSVKDVNTNCNGLLNKSKSFLSKHSNNNTSNYSVYFFKVSKGKYKLQK